MENTYTDQESYLGDISYFLERAAELMVTTPDPDDCDLHPALAIVIDALRLPVVGVIDAIRALHEEVIA